MAANRIFIQVDFQTQSATAAIGALNQNIQGIGSAAAASTAQATAGVKGFSVSVDGAKTAIDSLAQSLTGLGVARIAQELLSLGDALIRIRLGFENVRGGTQLWTQLRDVAEETAFSFRDLAENANALRNAGVPVSQVSNALKILADQAAYAGAGQEALNTAASKFADIWTRQKITGRELVAFREIGLQPTQILLDKLHISAQQFYEDTRLLNARPVLQSLLASAQAQSAGAAAGRADLLPSAGFNRVKNDIAEIARQLTEALGPALIGVMKQLRDFLAAVLAVVQAFKDLPEWVRTLAVDVGLLGIAFAAVATAMSLLRLPAFMEVVRAAGLAVEALVFGLNGTAGAIVTIGGASTTAAPAVTGLAASFTALGQAIILIGGAVVGYKVGEWLRELITGEKAAAKEQQDIMHDQLAFLAQNREKMLSQLSGKDLSATHTRPLAQYSDAELRDLINTYNQRIQAIKGTQEQLLAQDEKKAEEAIERAADLLDEAHRRNLMIGKESIGALTFAYEEHFRSVAGFAKAEALVRQALEIDISTEVKKATEERRKDSLKNAEELLALHRKVEIAAAAVQPDDTRAGKEAQARLVDAAYEEQIRNRAILQKQEYDRTIQPQIDDLRAMGGHAEQIATFEKQMADKRAETFAIADAQIAEHRLQSEREVNALIEEERKQLAEQELQDQLSVIEQSRNLRVATLGAAAPDSLPERLKQIRDVQAANIEAIEKTRDARIAAAKSEYELFAASHMGAPESVAEAWRNFEHTRIVTSRDAEVQIQLDRISLWKESNDAIIEEQKKVYEGIKSAADKVWDALLSKSQSVWAALGNALKSAVLNAMKEIVTSRVSASIASMFGYGNYSFKRGIAGIYEPPSPSGLGIPLELPGIGAASGSGILPLTTDGAQGGSDRSVGDEFTQAARDAAAESVRTGSADAVGPGTTAGGVPAAARPQMQQNISRMRESFNIGKPIIASQDTVDALGNKVPAGGTIPWSAATGSQRLGSMLSSQGLATLGFSAGSMLALSGLQRGGPMGGAQGIAGSTLAAVSAARLFPGLGLGLSGVGAGLLGAGLGVMAYGLERGGKAGLGMSIGGAALAGAVIGTALPGIGTLVGAGVGAAVGAIAGLIRLVNPPIMDRVRTEIQRVYGIDISSLSIRKQIADIITQKYGGNVSLGIFSPDVQEIVHLYALSTGQGQASLGRPMYSATMAQSQAGGLQLQPVYSNGQLVQNPYTGITTTQVQNSLANNPAVYMQLQAQQAVDLFSGQVVKVVGANPGAVAQANATATRSGDARVAQASSIMEPMTVTR